MTQTETVLSIGTPTKYRRCYITRCTLHFQQRRLHFSHDLENICRQLHLENCIEELMGELGADKDGKISFEKFFDRKCALRPEIRGLKKKYLSRETNDYLPASSSNNSLGICRSVVDYRIFDRLIHQSFLLGKHECWEFDSGARDLSPEPSTMQRLIDTAGGSTSAGNLLQLANKVSIYCQISSNQTEKVKLIIAFAGCSCI